jgi:ferric-dicitrate binding protein FerR (iron transport regulator)
MTATANSKPQCSKEIWSTGRWHPQQCTRRGRVQVNGYWYCKIHDPAYRQAKRDKRVAQWQEKEERNQRVRQEGERLAQRLGLPPEAMALAFDIRTASYPEQLVVTFEQAERLAQQLKERG